MVLPAPGQNYVALKKKTALTDQEHPLGFREARPDPAQREKMIRHDRLPITLILDHLHDPRNIGSMFRLADASRLTEIIMVGMPEMATKDKIHRVARSTMQYVPFRQVNNVAECLEATSLDLWALEWTNHSIPYHQWKGKLPIGLVIGNEQRGVSEAFFQVCRGSIHLPMLGMNTSMNVSVATGIAVYGLLQQAGELTERD